MIKDPRERFSGTADLYARWRPTYPGALIDWILALAPTGRIADIGCGTGISTRLFLERGRDAVGIDPNEAMLEEARRGPGTFLRGEAAATGLPDASMALVVAGQAFHWFDLEPTFRELRRILAPGGRACAFWNSRTRSPFLDAYEQLLRSASTEYPRLRGLDQTIEDLRRKGRDVTEAAFPHRQTLDLEGLKGRAGSSSYVVHGVADRAAFDRALEDLFARHQRGGAVEFAYSSLAVAFRPG